MHRFKMALHERSTAAVTNDAITISPGSRFRAAMVLAIMVDALQIVVFPLLRSPGANVSCHT
jgi:hypothetical protein